MNAPTLKLVAVVFPGFELLDLYGPLELFGMLGAKVDVVVAAANSGPVQSSQAPKGWADASLESIGAVDILLVPGGLGTRKAVEDQPLLQHLARLSAKAKYVTSVCTGSALLARAGILDGVQATSNKRAFAWVVSQGPKVQWVYRARWIEAGRYFTSSGVSAGMDMSLALIERLFGKAEAEKVARRAEYTAHRDSTFDPFASVEGTSG